MGFFQDARRPEILERVWRCYIKGTPAGPWKIPQKPAVEALVAINQMGLGGVNSSMCVGLSCREAMSSCHWPSSVRTTGVKGCILGTGGRPENGKKTYPWNIQYKTVE